MTRHSARHSRDGDHWFLPEEYALIEALDSINVTSDEGTPAYLKWTDLVSDS